MKYLILIFVFIIFVASICFAYNDEIMLWAFGDNWEILTPREACDIWNEKHPKCFKCESWMEWEKFIAMVEMVYYGEKGYIIE